jgi:hypothetical protein
LKKINKEKNKVLYDIFVDLFMANTFIVEKIYDLLRFYQQIFLIMGII